MANETLLTNIEGLVPDIKAEALFILNKTAGIMETVRIKDISGQPGSTADFPIFGTVGSSDVSSKTEGTAVTTNKQITNAATQALVAEKFIATFISKLALESSMGDLVADTSKLFANAMAAKAEDDVVGLFGSFATTIAGAGTTLTVDHIFQGVSNLYTNKADLTRAYAVVSPKQYWGQKGVRTLIVDANADSGNLGEEMKSMGFVSDAFGLKWYVSNEINEDVASGGDAAGAIYAHGAIGLGHKGMFDVWPDAVPRNLGFDIIGYGYWKAVELVDLWGNYLLTDVA